MTGTATLADKSLPPAPRPFSERLKAALIAPVKAMRLRYLPLLTHRQKQPAGMP